MSSIFSIMHNIMQQKKCKKKGVPVPPPPSPSTNTHRCDNSIFFFVEVPAYDRKEIVVWMKARQVKHLLIGVIQNYIPLTHWLLVNWIYTTSMAKKEK